MMDCLISRETCPCLLKQPFTAGILTRGIFGARSPSIPKSSLHLDRKLPALVKGDPANQGEELQR